LKQTNYIVKKFLPSMYNKAIEIYFIPQIKSLKNAAASENCRINFSKKIGSIFVIWGFPRKIAKIQQLDFLWHFGELFP
jgi:hypothetical protein